MAAPNAGSGLIFNSTATVGGVVTPPVASKQYFQGSYHTKSDGTQTVTVDVQVSNIPARAVGYAATTPIRDDSYASTDWVTVSTNVMTAVAASRMDTVAYLSHRVSRLRLTSGAGTRTVSVWIALQGNE